MHGTDPQRLVTGLEAESSAARREGQREPGGAPTTVGTANVRLVLRGPH